MSKPELPAASVLEHVLGDHIVRYATDPLTGVTGLHLAPRSRRDREVARRQWMDEPEVAALNAENRNIRARFEDSLVQVKIAGDEGPGGFAQGRTMRNSSTTLALRLRDQRVVELPGAREIITELVVPGGLEATHTLRWRERGAAIEIETTLRNQGPALVRVELLSSFSLGGLTPYATDGAAGRLVAHRLRSAWSAEARLVSETIEALNLERSWQGDKVRCERYGQVGTMPVRGFHPFAAVEDREAGVCWAAQLAWAGSWQMELYRQSDDLCLSGGLADREFGHWSKDLAPGEILAAPRATLVAVPGDVDAACRRLVRHAEATLPPPPAGEEELPVVANEFCTSWGEPTHERLEKIARRLQGSGVRYLVIDAGWYCDPGKSWANAHGDWQASEIRFPGGLRATADMIRAHGLVPGLWFEIETCGSDSAAFADGRGLLRLDDRLITADRRRFWDLESPESQAHCGRMIDILREGGFGYLKIDYNETLGVGADGAESPGEKNRRHILAVHAFWDRVRRELPELVIENCSSGGHRLEPSMLARSHMSAFSDAHECPEATLIAANVLRVVPARQNQVWAVLRSTDSRRRLTYVLAAGFLGRLCISGDLDDLEAEQWAFTSKAVALHREAASVIRDGQAFFHGPEIASYRSPQGWRAVLRLADDGRRALLVSIAYAGEGDERGEVCLPGDGTWRITGRFGSEEPGSTLADAVVRVRLPAPYCAEVLLLERAPATA